MRRAWWLLPACAVLACGVALAPARGDDKKADDKKPADKKPEEKKGPVVDLGGLKANVPGSWKEETPKSKIRLKQYKLAKAEGDKEDGEVVIFQGILGTVKQNIDRWKAQFTPPKDKKLEDVAKLTKMKVGGNDVQLLDIQGTFGGKDDYRMLAVQIQTKKETYHVKLIGPAKTVEKFREGFVDWLKALK
jgi:hypothetical protein